VIAMPSATALLTVDLQQGFIAGPPALYETKRVLDVVSGLQERARRAGALVVHTQFAGADGHPAAAGTPGFAIHPSVAPHPGDLVIVKEWTDCFQGTDLHARLRSAGCRRLVVAGCMTELCVDTTCRRALSLDYEVTLVADGHSTADACLFDTIDPATRIRMANHVLRRVEAPAGAIEVKPAAEVTFG
jgi:nicotinamidase-related amidase